MGLPLLSLLLSLGCPPPSHKPSQWASRGLHKAGPVDLNTSCLHFGWNSGLNLPGWRFPPKPHGKNKAKRGNTDPRAAARPPEPTKRRADQLPAEGQASMQDPQDAGPTPAAESGSSCSGTRSCCCSRCPFGYCLHTSLKAHVKGEHVEIRFHSQGS